MADNGIVMYYVHDENKKIQLEVLCMGMAFRTRQLKASDLNSQMGELAQIKGIKPLDMETVEKAPAIFCMPEVIIFSGIPNKAIDEFMKSYRNTGLTPAKLKAVITPVNVKWTLYQLIRELADEYGRIESKVSKISNANLNKKSR